MKNGEQNHSESREESVEAFTDENISSLDPRGKFSKGRGQSRGHCNDRQANNNSKIAKMNLDYIAGFFDGEGCVGRRHENHNGKKYRYFQLAISNTNKIVIDEIRKFLGFGYLHKQIKKNPKHNDSYVFQLSDHNEIVRFIDLMLSRCIVKKNKMEEIKKEILERKWISPQEAGRLAATN